MILSQREKTTNFQHHNKTFVINAHFGEQIMTKGVGKSKKEAEQNAAKAALEIIK